MATEAKESEAPDTLSIWNRVSKTDPANTKRVNQRGGFTAISAHSQIMEATRAFGPVGIGWGYVNGDPIFHDALVIVPVTLWHGDRGNAYGPVYGSAEVRDAKGRLDSDAPKKAATDGLTKGLSHLGFNADVFLGLYDDNKYVEQVRAEFAAGEAANDTPQHDEPAAREKLDGKHSSKSSLKAALKEIHLKASAAQSEAEVDALVKQYAADIDQAIRYLPKWISGDPTIGADGLEKHIENRRAVLSLADSFRQCATGTALARWYAANETAVDELDDIQRRDFDNMWNAHEAGMKLAATVRS